MTNWKFPAPAGFQGLRDDLPLEVYTRHLPHWRQRGATYFVTFRLADSLPQTRLREFRAIVDDWHARNPEPTRSELQKFVRTTRGKVEGWLDEGHGECTLGAPDCADTVARALEHFDGERYELGCCVVMPNHVHVLVRPCGGRELERILQSWKRFTATEINRRLGRSGSLWQEESIDTIVRDEEHLWNAIRYVGRNPERAGLDDSVCRLWIRPEWDELGWGFDGTDGLEIRPTEVSS